MEVAEAPRLDNSMKLAADRRTSVAVSEFECCLVACVCVIRDVLCMAVVYARAMCPVDKSVKSSRGNGITRPSCPGAKKDDW